ncbi:MAG: hypothetical protein K8R58_14940 [Bacteroidales bacterium]|nr:hypothetical protein [Bacteroidales bacterium]
MKKIKEKFRAVEFMRKQREALSKLHKENPEVYRKQLEEIKRKYALKFKKKKEHVA